MYAMQIRKKLLLMHKLTPFQKKVLLEVANLRLGETITYADLALRINRKNSCRAVGNALNKNPLPLIIPCHRVIASDGYGGYKYGRPAKRILLSIEKVLSKLHW